VLRIVVCVKAVPDPRMANQIRIDPVTRSLQRADVPLVMNPLDKNALETAIQLKERQKAHITVLSMGPLEAAKIVREGLALGADDGILLSDRSFAGADAYATAFTLAQAIKVIGVPSLVLCGMASSDGSTEWVGPMMAVFLGMPVVTKVSEIISPNNGQWRVKSRIENGYRLVRVNLPAVLTVTRDLTKPRPLRFSGIVRAQKKDIPVWGIEHLEVTENDVGLKGSPTVVSKLTTRIRKRQVKFISGTREEMVERLIQELIQTSVL
jgi:electron transfer flavoprotein beta subunit